MLNGHDLTGANGNSIRLPSLLDALMPAGSGAGQSECRASAGDSIQLTNFHLAEARDHQHIDVLDSKGGLRGSKQ